MAQEGTKKELIAKVAKLIALAEDDAATPNEKELAAKHAARLMSKYGLEERDIRVDDATAEQVVRYDYCIGGRRTPTWEGYLGAVITEIFDCQIVRSKKYSEENGTVGLHTYLVFIGLPKDVDVCIYFFKHLRRSVGRKTETTRTRFKKDFAIGMVERLEERLQQAFRYRYQFAEEAGCTDLIVLKGQLVDQAKAEMFRKLTKGAPIRLGNHDAWQAGRREGDKVNISRPIAHNGAAGRQRLDS
jgi:hypothetical protein